MFLLTLTLTPPPLQLYTSGSTGQPKGVLHTTAGFMAGIALTYKYVFDHRWAAHAALLCCCVSNNVPRSWLAGAAGHRGCCCGQAAPCCAPCCALLCTLQQLCRCVQLPAWPHRGIQSAMHSQRRPPPHFTAGRTTCSGAPPTAAGSQVGDNHKCGWFELSKPSVGGWGSRVTLLKGGQTAAPPLRLLGRRLGGAGSPCCALQNRPSPAEAAGDATRARGALQHSRRALTAPHNSWHCCPSVVPPQATRTPPACLPAALLVRCHGAHCRCCSLN